MTYHQRMGKSRLNVYKTDFVDFLMSHLKIQNEFSLDEGLKGTGVKVSIFSFTSVHFSGDAMETRTNGTKQLHNTMCGYLPLSAVTTQLRYMYALSVGTQ